MTDCKDIPRLIERLDAMHVSAPELPSCRLCGEAKEALEAKDKRIAELESEAKEQAISMGQLCLRVAELEGDLEVMRLQRDAKRWTRESHDN